MRVFLGSTFEDLKSHRRRVIDGLKALGMHIEAMELWWAQPEDPVSVCLSRVRESDIYICVVAWRYGSLAEDQRSYTQLEYEAARQASRDCLVFLMRDDYRIRPEYVDKGDAASRLAAFRQVLLGNHHCLGFGSPAELAHQVVESVRNLMRERRVPGAEAVDMAQFWSKLHAVWQTVEPEELRMEFNAQADALELLSALHQQLEGISGFEDQIAKSHDLLEADLTGLLTRAGYDPGRLSEVPYYENPLINRDWEWINLGLPNMLTSCRILLAQLRVKWLELMIQTQERDDLRHALEEAKQHLEDAVREGRYID